MILGAQLYTLRNYCKNLDDFDNTLKRVSAIGYRTVQVSGTCEYDASWLNEKLDQYKLTCAVTHIPYEKIVHETQKVIKDHKTFGSEYIGLGSMPQFARDDIEGYHKFVEELKPALQLLKDSGLYFLYHNHHFEFKKLDGERIINRLLSDFSCDEFGFTLDTYWVQAAGGDPCEWIQKLCSRLKCIHLKDMDYQSIDKNFFGSIKMMPVYEGNMNFDRIIETALNNPSCKYALVEQDDCNGEDEFDCMAKSYTNIRRKFNI